MTHKTKIILASVAGAVVLIPIVLFIVIVLWIYFDQSSLGATTGSTGMSSRSFYQEDSSASSFGGSYEMAAAPSSSKSTSFDEQVSTGDTATEIDQKIIKTGYLDITVDVVDESMTKISALTTGKGGYMQSSSVYEREDGTKYGTVTARIPASEFENAIIEIKKMATVVNTESVNGQDVTEEYADLEAQLHNAQAQEAEYLEILKKATSVEDILNVQSYLGQVREQIETLQGRIKYLGNLTSYSTISVSLSEESTLRLPSKEFRPWSSIKEAAQALISVLQGLVITAIWLVILGGGVLLPIAVVIWLVVKLIKNRRSKK